MESNVGLTKGEKPSKIIKSVRSPISFMALSMLICNAVFAASAIGINDNIKMEAFKFAIHMFLAIVSIFALIAVWCPASLYHPQDLKEIDMEKLPPQRRWVPTLAAFFGMVIYILYYYLRFISGQA